MALLVNLLGGFSVYKDQQPVEITSRPARTLLAYLLLNRGANLRRERIAEALWPDVLPSSARQSLRSALYLLGKSLGREYLQADSVFLSFNTNSPFQLDLDFFEEEPDPTDLEALIRAVSVYKGDLLPGFDEAWVMLERERLRALFELRMQTLLARLMKKERWDESILWAERYFALGNLPEPAFRTLIKAHARRNDIASMTTVYQRYVQALQAQLGVSPSQETQELYSQLLKSQSHPAQLAGRKDSSGDSSLSPTFRQKRGLQTSHLPSFGTSFVGREREIAEIRNLLVNEKECRLLTLTGPGGIGKTRLAIQAVHDLEFEGGVWFLSLAAVQSATSLLSRLIELFGISYQEGEHPRKRLLRFLISQKLLLILDNFEHLLPNDEYEQAEEDAVGLIADLLQQGREVKILLTSRERLNLSLEWIFPVEGLEIEKAVQLFLQRAKQVNRKIEFDDSEGEAVYRICELVGGLPLAVEMAAAWTQILSCSQIAEDIRQGLEILSTNLRDFPVRHQKMRVVFDSSWNRLSGEEQKFSRRLAIFQGEFSREAAEQVCFTEEAQSGEHDLLPEQYPAAVTLGLLSSLAEKSFLQQAAPDRYRVHELLRQYTGVRLIASGEEKIIRSRHSQYYLTFMASLEPGLKGSDQGLALDRIAGEMENIMAGWYWAAQEGLVDLLIQSMEAFWLFSVMRERMPEVASTMKHTASLLDQLSPSDVIAEDVKRRVSRGMIHAVAAGSQMMAGDHDEAEDLMKQAVLQLSECNARRWIALVRNWQAYNSLAQGNLEQAHQYIQESIEISEQVDDQWLLAYSLNDLGLITHLLGNPAQAKTFSLKGMEIFKTIDDRRGMAFVYSNLGLYASTAGDDQDALYYYEESRKLRELNNDQLGLANTLIRIGIVWRALGDPGKSHQNLVNAIRIADNRQLLPELLDGIVELAILFEQNGEVERAWRFLSVSLAHPFLRREAKEKARQLQEKLSLSGVARVENQWSQIIFEDEVRYLLDDLLVLS